MQDKKLVSAPLQAEKFCKETNATKKEDNYLTAVRDKAKKAFNYVYFADFESFTKND